jgi:Ca-activated chloride channel family protein
MEWHTSQYLILLVVIPIALIYIHWLAKKRQSLVIKYLPQVRFNGQLFLSSVILLGVIALLVITLAQPFLASGSSRVSGLSRQVVFCLDISNSMTAQDIAPSRLEAGKLIIKKIIQKNPKTKFGLVLFTNKAAIEVPVSLDHSTLLSQLQVANVNSMSEQGTSLSNALHTAYLALLKNTNGGKGIVLVTDGEDHEQGMTPILDEIAAEGISVITLGIGSKEGATVFDSFGSQLHDESGNLVHSVLKEENLMQIASDTKGIYVPIHSTQDALSSINDVIQKLDEGLATQSTLKSTKQLFMYPLSIALIALSVYMYRKN